MLEFVLNLIIFVISFAFIVVVHEFGHYITAKIFKVYVTEFSIGFGPAIFKKKKEGGETEFSIRGIPLGGYCAMVGESFEDVTPEEYESLSEKDKKLVDLYKSVPADRRLDGVARWKRAIIMIAGIVLNFVLAFGLFTGYAATSKTADNSIRYVFADEDGLLYQNGYIEKSEIIAGSATYVITYDENVGAITKTKEEDDITCTQDIMNLFTIEKEYLPYSPTDYVTFDLTCVNPQDQSLYHVIFTLNVVANSDYDLYGGYIYTGNVGITFYGRWRTFGEIFVCAGETFVDGATMVFDGLKMLFTPKGFEAMGGVISIFEMSSKTMDEGISYYFFLWGIISVNLGIMNLLPFPGLDGWHFLVIIIESITRKELPKKFKTIMSNIGMILLFGLMIVITCKDIIGLF